MAVVRDDPPASGVGAFRQSRPQGEHQGAAVPGEPVRRPGEDRPATRVDDQIAPVDPLAALELDRFERARDPSHARTLPDIDLRHLFEANELVLLRSQFQTQRRKLDYYLDLAGCTGDARARAVALSPGGPESYVAESAWYLLRKGVGS